jgi:hypothetical protein
LLKLDLGPMAVVDDHSHGFRLADCLAADPSRLEERLTFLGLMYGAAADYLQPDEAELRQVRELTASTLFAMTARRRLARLLRCEETADEVAAARRAALAADPRAYVARLFADQNVRGLLVDEGYPEQPPVPRREFQDEMGVPVFRAWRIENHLLDAVAGGAESADGTPSFDELEDGFVAALAEAAGDEHTVAFKSVLAYVGGLEVGGRDREETAGAYARWIAAGTPLEGADAREVFGHLLRITLREARRHDRPVHIHCGAGDPSMTDIRSVTPRHLYPLLHEHRAQPIVLVHSGNPWLSDAAYVASVLPHVYLDLSAWQPWATTGTDAALQTLIGLVPLTKLLHGTDNVREPEILWLGALLMKEALHRVLGGAVENDYLSTAQAAAAAAGILGANTVRLHGLDPALLTRDRRAGVSV